MNERFHIASAALSLGDDLVGETAFAIWQAFVRERDPDRARKRFSRVPQATKEQFESEARAAIRVADGFRMGDYR